MNDGCSHGHDMTGDSDGAGGVAVLYCATTADSRRVMSRPAHLFYSSSSDAIMARRMTSFIVKVVWLMHLLASFLVLLPCIG
jgi:hypothetical protein